MPDDHFLGETLHPVPAVTPTVTDGPPICCLCDEPITSGSISQQRFETDPTGQAYSAHARCAYEYALAMAAFRNAIWHYPLND